MAESFAFNLDPVSFITVGAVGPAGQRTFYLQAAQRRRVVSLVIEKEHAIALAVSLSRLLKELESHDPEHAEHLAPTEGSMALIEPLRITFRVENIGIGVDEDRHMIILIASEQAEEEDGGRKARFVANYAQVMALAEQAADVVQQGRPLCRLCGEPIDAEGHFCPPRNGHARLPD